MNNFLIIGYGLIGKERLKSLIKIYSNKNFTCDVYDPNIDKNHEDFKISNKIKILQKENIILLLFAHPIIFLKIMHVFF
jgi:hypothetical protein